MSRLEEALRRAEGTTGADNFSAPSAHALESFVPDPETSDPAAERVDRPQAQASGPVGERGARSPLLTAAVQAPKASSIPLGGAAAERLVVHAAIAPAVVEQYRKIAATLHHAQADRGARVLMIASAFPGEGKTLTVTNLALTLSESYRRRVLVVDADLRRPMMHEMLGAENRAGLNEALACREDRRVDVVQVTPRLALLPAGRPDPDPMSALTSERMKRLISEAAERFDWVILDTPPLAVLPDANLLAAMVDVAILVVGAGRTPAEVIQAGVEALGRERVIGVVLNRAEESSVGEYGYDSYYSGYLASKKAT